MSQVYIKLREGASVFRTHQMPTLPSIIVDFDSDGIPIGIEILNAIGVTIDGEDAVKAIEDLEWLHHDQRASQ